MDLSTNVVQAYLGFALVCLIGIFVGGASTDDAMLKIMKGLAITGPIVFFFSLFFELVVKAMEPKKVDDEQ